MGVWPPVAGGNVGGGGNPNVGGGTMGVKAGKNASVPGGPGGVPASSKVNPPNSVPSPSGVKTVTFTVAVSSKSGVSQVMLVSLTTTRLVAEVSANATSVAPVKPVPVMVTAVAVSGKPVFGAILVISGTAIHRLQRHCERHCA
jgi:hypothetical protein